MAYNNRYFQVGPIASQADFDNAANWSLTNDVAGAGAGVPGENDLIIRGSAAPAFTAWSGFSLTCWGFVDRDDCTTVFTLGNAAYVMNVGNNGEGIYILCNANKTSTSQTGRHNISVSECYIWNTSNAANYIFLTDCDFAVRGSLNAVANNTPNIAAGATVRMVTTLSAFNDATYFTGTPTAATTLSLNGGNFIVDGVLDLTNVTELTMRWSSGIPQLNINGTLRNGSTDRTVSINGIAVLHCIFRIIEGRFTANLAFMEYNATTLTNIGGAGFAQLESTTITQYASSPVTRLRFASNTVLGDTTFIFDQGLVTLAVSSAITVVGDINVSGAYQLTAASGVTLSILCSGTSDQDIDLSAMSDTVSFFAQKTAGDVSLSGNFNLYDDSEINGVLTNNGTLDVPDGLLFKVNKYIDTSTGTLSGGGTLKTQSIVPA